MAIVLDQAQRDAGTYYSAELAVPLGTAEAAVVVPMTQADRQDPATRVRSGLEVMHVTKTGGVWREDFGASFEGGPNVSGDFAQRSPVPYLHQWLLETGVAPLVRAFLSLENRTNAGLDLTLL